MKKLILLFAILLPASLFLSACGNSNSTNQEKNDKLNVYTTVYPLQYFTERIAGDLVDVDTIYPPGADEHTFEPSQKDMMKLADSDLFIFIGLGLEGFVEKAKDTLENEQVSLLPAGENIHLEESGHSGEEHEEEGHSEEGHSDSEEGHTEEGHSDSEEGHTEEGHSDSEEGHTEEGHSDSEEGHTEEGHSDSEEGHSHSEEGHSEEEHSDSEEGHDGHEGHNHGDIDPHVWLDPIYSKELAEAIKLELVRLLPDHKNELETNFEQLANELDELDEKFEKTISTAAHKEILVSHKAYGYWENRYGMEQISISGVSTSSEPSQKELENIINEAREHGLSHVFFEQNVSSKLTEIVQNELNAEALTLHNLSVLTDEDLKEKRTYFSIMEDNLKGLEKALNSSH
ncbi:zinc ABC transporter substrate-binding protein [Cytobacillus spongiae]|uniref:metal ABC transporter solute-binding protein, Zn/Mn family n=1 Tax=Cytobacillus spongiae TaxID=2901381 RepID=UPI001F2250CF|nr:zinc ABC transporter substrate-binding protein [Cytobacillus spongiae]UII55304.1 zinc ABC transporter substrate-binding protein [Cytobacillus spongiae]